MRNCQSCGFKKWLKPDQESDRWKVVEGICVRQWKCGRCGRLQPEERPFDRQPPKVLYFDIETSLMTVATFDLHIPQKYIPLDHIIQRSFIICWAAAWVKDGEFLPVMSDSVRWYEAKTGDDHRCLTWLWQLMDSADYIVGHNSDSFDVKKINYRFIRNGMGLPYKAKQVDTLKQLRKYTRGESNKLDEWSKIFGGGGKEHMEYDDWHRIRTNPTGEDLAKMEHYCRRDVREGATVYRDLKKIIEARGDPVLK